MKKWLNNKQIIHAIIKKPCESCGYCPYGQLVEAFPLHPNMRSAYKRKKIECKVFGHDCPAYYMAEDICE